MKLKEIIDKCSWKSAGKKITTNAINMEIGQYKKHKSMMQGPKSELFIKSHKNLQDKKSIRVTRLAKSKNETFTKNPKIHFINSNISSSETLSTKKGVPDFKESLTKMKKRLQSIFDNYQDSEKILIERTMKLKKENEVLRKLLKNK